jgi:hypothetical protein
MRNASESARHRFRLVAATTLVALTAVALAPGLLVGCGDDEQSTDDPDQSPGEILESTGARGLAEAVRVALVEDDLGPDQHERDVDVIEESIEDLPVDPDVAGIVDDDRDGQDDDGKVELHVNSEAACLSIAMDGDVEVTSGAC